MLHFMRHIRPACILLALMAPCVGVAQDEVEKPKKLSGYELSVKYAKTRMNLAETELRLAQEARSGAVPKMRIERLRSGLEIARRQYEEAVAASSGGNERVQLRHAEERIRLAEIELETGRRMLKQRLVQPLEVERLELKYELARLRLQVLKNPENFTTLLHYMETRVDRLADEILAIDQRVSKLEPTRGFIPQNP